MINQPLVVEIPEEASLFVCLIGSPWLDTHKTSSRWWEFFGWSGDSEIGRVDLGFAIVALVLEFQRVSVHNTIKSGWDKRVLVIHIHGLRGRLSIVKHSYRVWFGCIIKIGNIAWSFSALAGEDTHLVLLSCEQQWLISLFRSSVHSK